jgi:signal transduction histidine kinase
LNGSGSGLRGLAERAAVVGGSVAAGPSPTGGFALRVTLPLRDHGSRATPIAVTEGVG